MIVLDTPEQIRAYHNAALLKACEMEVRGARSSRGSAYATAKKRFGLKGNRQNVAKQLKALLDKDPNTEPVGVRFKRQIEVDSDGYFVFLEEQGRQLAKE